jgi:rhodanese-related sulfurtransferase
VAVQLGFTDVYRYIPGMADWDLSGRFREVGTAAAVSALLDAGATPVDLRDTTAFDAGHLPNALNVLATDVPVLPGELGTMDRATPLVLYGAGGGDRDEYTAAFVLEASGFTSVFYYTGGWADWSASMK